MQGQHQYQPELFSQIDYESLVPKNHLLRRIDQVLNLNFLQELTKSFYSAAFGRPSIAPEIFVRMVLLQAIYNIDSDRQLCEEIGYNLAYRWFCKLSLTDKIPDHSSMTKIRDRLGEKTFEIIFNQVLEQCRSKGLIKLDQMMVDGSMIKANASIYAMKEREEAKSKDDDKDPPSYNGQIHSKDGLSNNDLRKKNITGQKISNKTHVSISDPEATLAGKAFEAKSLAYKTHHAIDASSRVIVDCHVTTGNVSDISMFQERMNAIQEKLKLNIGEVIADRGYGSAENLKYLEEKEIKSNIPLWSSSVGATFFEEINAGFKVETENKKVFCPEGHEMKFSSDDRTGQRSLWTLKRSVCMKCPRVKMCLTANEYKVRGKRFAVPDYYELFERITEKQKEPEFKKKLWERMWKMEGIFAEAKSHHGLRRARYRGRWKMQAQVYIISIVQNLKRLAASTLENLDRILRILLENVLKLNFGHQIGLKSF